MKIAIVGGGIGGMTLALALADAGLRDVDVYESAPAIRELGVGINLPPHGVRELAELGLLDDLLAEGIPTADETYYSKHGQRIWHEPLGQAILDARVLARELALQPSIEAAVTAYNGQRRPATSTVVRANRQEGPLLCQNLVEERAPDGFTNLENVVSQQELAEIVTGYRRGAGFDPSILNDRPSLSVHT